MVQIYHIHCRKITVLIVVVLMLMFMLMFIKTQTLFRSENVHNVHNIRLRHPGFNTSYLINKCTGDLQNTDREYFDLRIFVLTYNRAASVKRLLSSLNVAKYGNSSVKLEVWIDRSLDGRVDAETLSKVQQFSFAPGIFQVCIHEKHVGVMGQWLIPWKPKVDSKEIAVFIEDDMTVSPYFYKYLKIVHSKYRHMSKINGFALQGISIKHNNESEGYVEISPNEMVYLYPTIGTWGFSPKASNWKHFLKWFEENYHNVTFEPLVPFHVCSTWYRMFAENGNEDSLWDMWHTHHSWLNKEWVLYPTFQGHKGLVFNWKENGLHYQGQTETSMDEEQKQLLLEWKQDYEMLPEVPIYVDNRGMIIPPPK